MAVRLFYFNSPFVVSSMRNDRPYEWCCQLEKRNGNKKRPAFLWEEVLKAQNKSTTLLTSFRKSGKVRDGINKMGSGVVGFLSAKCHMYVEALWVSGGIFLGFIIFFFQKKDQSDHSSRCVAVCFAVTK